MATTLQELSSLLDGSGIKHGLTDDGTTIVLSYEMNHYRDRDADASLLLTIEVDEDGEYVRVAAPDAYRVRLAHRDAFLQACLMVQQRTKLVQFEWAGDATLTPLIELPLEDAAVTARQLERCVRSMVVIVDEYHDALALVAATGAVDREHLDAPELARFSGEWEELLETFPASVLEAALERARARER